jgi:hypothetical protein
MTVPLVACKAKIRKEKGVGRNRSRWWLHIPRPVAALLPTGGVELRVGLARTKVVLWAGAAADRFTLTARLWVHEDKDRGTICFPDSPGIFLGRLNQSPDVAEGWLFLDPPDPDGRWKFRLRWEYE